MDIITTPDLLNNSHLRRLELDTDFGSFLCLQSFASVNLATFRIIRSPRKFCSSFVSLLSPSHTFSTPQSLLLSPNLSVPTKPVQL